MKLKNINHLKYKSMETLYNLTKADAKILLNCCENNIESLALLLWDKGKVKTLENGVKKAKKIKNFANGHKL